MNVYINIHVSFVYSFAQHAWTGSGFTIDCRVEVMNDVICACCHLFLRVRPLSLNK